MGDTVSELTIILIFTFYYIKCIVYRSISSSNIFIRLWSPSRKPLSGPGCATLSPGSAELAKSMIFTFTFAAEDEDGDGDDDDDEYYTILSSN